MDQGQDINRRPLKSRGAPWAVAIAARLARCGIHPNLISTVSSVFAAGTGLFLWAAGRQEPHWRFSTLLILAAVGMQLRLLCNLFDGMVAIEGGRKTKAGELFNELPDRFSDAFIFIGAGYATQGVTGMPELGWSAAVLSVITAYTRALGASMGAGQQFLGPMAKPQRMAAMTVACLLGAGAPQWPGLVYCLPATLVLVVIGCILTIIRRCRQIVRAMATKP